MIPEGAHALTILLLAAFGPASGVPSTAPRERLAQVQELSGTVKRVDLRGRIVGITPRDRSTSTRFVAVADRTRLYGPKGVIRLDDFGAGDTVHVVLQRPDSAARSIQLISRWRE